MESKLCPQCGKPFRKRTKYCRALCYYEAPTASRKKGLQSGVLVGESFQGSKPVRVEGPSLKLLFLDIDGVLNSVKQRLEGRWDDGTRTLDPEALKRLERIMVKTECAVVLTSVWRKRETLSTTQLNFRKKGFPLELIQRFIGSTSVLHEDRCRGREIDLWLKALGGDPKFAILDDGYDLDPYLHRLVQVNGQLGLQDSDVSKVLELFT